MSQLDFHNVTRYFTVYFDEYQGEGGYIAIKVPAETGSYKYLKVDNILVEQVASMSITGYTNANNGWNLIASPMVGSLQPTSVENMISETEENYDLFAFDQSKEGSEWQNYKVHGFGLQNGQGYLYANSSDVTLGFGGALQPAASVEVPLVYVDGKPCSGWNLVGNPLTTAATIDKPFYRMNEGGTALTAKVEAGNTVAAMEGVFVQTTQEGQTALFTQVNNGQGNEKSEVPMINVNLTRNRGEILVNAIVRFDNGETLGAFSFREDNAKLYIPQGEEEFAIASSDKQGELPLNFKAKENGSYTITVAPEGVEMNYLHLIDNLTGDDIDLLSTPSYTFNAKTTDYESRFRLVFVCGNVDGDNETFAFFANGQLIINGEGTAQVIDMLGRILINETVKGSASKVIDQPAGIYMIRLINGENIKVQKVVVK
jgi:hypothetical protein